VDPELQARRTAEGRAITYWATVAPERLAIASPYGDRSFAELDARADQLVRGLRGRGITAGDGVALVARNRPEFVEVWAACRRAGLRLTPINWHLTVDEMSYIVSDCEARALVVDSGVAPAVELGEHHADALLVLTIGDAPTMGEPYAGVVGTAATGSIDDATPGSLMLYTSGTTGRPKGVRKQPHPPIVDNLAGYDAESVHLCTGPLYHAAPLNISLISPLSNGAPVVLMDTWTAPETLRLIEHHRVTHTHVVRTMFHRMLALDDETRDAYDLSSLRLVVHGAAPCPVPVKQAMIAWLGPVLVEYYASTEGAGTLVDATTWLRKPGTVGRPYPDDQIIVGDEDAQPVPAGEIGTVWVKSLPGEEFEYFHDPEKTERNQRGAWYTLGDLGYVDEDGYLFLAGRSAELIISGGVNIYPAEIDAVLLEHPAVRDVATIGIPNDEWGEEVLAVVELAAATEPSSATTATLIEHCRERLARFKCPRAIEFVEQLPRQDNGKVYRQVLRDRFAARP